MTRWTPERRALLEGLAAELLHNYGRGRTIVAVDGPRAPGRPAFADDLAEALRKRGHDVFRASIEDFQNPREKREAQGRDSARGRYLDSYDYAAFRRVLIEPFRMNGSTGFVTAHWDAERDRQVEPKWLTGPLDAMLVVDGTFLNRPELRGIWNASVWLDVESDADEVEAGALALYEKDARPRQNATVIVDGTDPDAPKRRFADSC